MSAPTTSLVLIEHAAGRVQDASLSAVSAALRMGPVHALVAGDGEDARAAAAQAATVAGIEKVWLALDPAHAHLAAEAVAPLAAQLMGEYGAFVAAATSTGKAIAPRLAALLDVMQVSEVIEIDPDVEGGPVFTRPIYAGNALARVQSLDAKLVLTVRGTAFDKAAAAGGSATIEPVSGPGATAGSRWISLDASASERPELTSATVIVSGGRALKDAETFERLIAPLADKLGAAIGASRAAVDAGYISNDFQIGQTGKIVAPDLYIAVGISGAIQHLAGMKDARTIVAINKDPDAPIFQVADIGLVADIFEAVPELTERL